MHLSSGPTIISWKVQRTALVDICIPHPEDNDPSYYKLVEDIFKLEDCQARRASGLEMADRIESSQIC